MPLVEDPEETCPTVAESQLQFVRNLNDTSSAYTRFIAALLIPRPSHAAFFRDLKSFRSQPVVIALLASCDRTDPVISKEAIKQSYRDVTSLFLQSRWSHPWCRRAAGNKDATVGSTGWWGAEWTSTGRRMSKKAKEAEDGLHQLLLPIWVIMRGRMFPGASIVDAWWIQKQEQDDARRYQGELGLEQDISGWLDKLDAHAGVHEIALGDTSDSDASEPDVQSLPRSNNPFRAGGSQVLRPVKTTPNMREMFWQSAEAEHLDEELRRKEREAAQAATSTFRLVAAGMLLSSVPKRKLRHLLKKK